MDVTAGHSPAVPCRTTRAAGCPMSRTSVTAEGARASGGDPRPTHRWACSSAIPHPPPPSSALFVTNPCTTSSPASRRCLTTLHRSASPSTRSLPADVPQPSPPHTCRVPTRHPCKLPWPTHYWLIASASDACPTWRRQRRPPALLHALACPVRIVAISPLSSIT
jgi:hypothetical protein